MPKKALVGFVRLWYTKEGFGMPKKALVGFVRLWYTKEGFGMPKKALVGFDRKTRALSARKQRKLWLAKEVSTSSGLA
jgi:hypothetical protein